MPSRKIKFENGEYYHIYNRGVDKRIILNDNYDIMRILESLSVFNMEECVGGIYCYSFEGKDKTLRHPMSKLVEIVAFNILDNHYHLILKQITDNGISRFMQKFGNGYTKNFNEKYKRNGSLFQGAFKAEHIDSDEYLNYVVTYVNANHLIHGLESLGNPVSKWGMRSSLEQYVNPKKEWRNLYFECNTEMIKGRYKNNKDYMKEIAGIAESIMEKRKEGKDLDIGCLSKML